MFFNSFAMLVVIILSGCTTQTIGIVHDQAYYPIPTITEDVVRRDGMLVGFRVKVRRMAPSQIETIDKRIEALRTHCVNGVEKEDRSTNLRPNPHVSKQYRSLYAVGHGIQEQLVLLDLDIRINCKRK